MKFTPAQRVAQFEARINNCLDRIDTLSEQCEYACYSGNCTTCPVNEMIQRQFSSIDSMERRLEQWAARVA